MRRILIIGFTFIAIFIFSACSSDENIVTFNNNNIKVFLDETDLIVSKYYSYSDLINSTYIIGEKVESNAFNEFKKKVKSNNYTEYSYVVSRETNEAFFTEVLRFGRDYKVRHGVLVTDGNKLSKIDPSPVATQIYVDDQLYQQNPDSLDFIPVNKDDQISFMGYSILSNIVEYDYEAVESYSITVGVETYIATYVKSSKDDTENRYFVFDKNSNLVGVIVDLKNSNKIEEFINIKFDKTNTISLPKQIYKYNK